MARRNRRRVLYEGVLVKDVFQWEQDKAGGDDGMATFYLDDNKISVHMYSFREAHAMSVAISAALVEARYNGRVSMLNEVSRVQP